MRFRVATRMLKKILWHYLGENITVKGNDKPATLIGGRVREIKKGDYYVYEVVLYGVLYNAAGVSHTVVNSFNDVHYHSSNKSSARG